MTNEEILSHVDHTLLKATASWSEIQKIAEEGIKYKTASICIPPWYVEPVCEQYRGLNVCTVIGFPLGYSTGLAKITEAKIALGSGASELDMVINIGAVKSGNFEAVLEEVKALREVARDRILKVIVETCYLTMEEKIRLCKIVTESGADYIKTSTGFGSAGATLDDVLLFRMNIGPNVKIKAAGGIKTREDMAAYLGAGCDRLGTSSALAILAGQGAGTY
ncbi:MAG: deoxyribose-phosphate aldolase [Treponema sp.]|nr:deoxyribose-phosphate aldolase [Treponema sp.]